ncbi:MAG: hypothetical protein WB662_05310, partial [Methyloceanibacter sp.]
LFTVVLAHSTVFLWRKTKDLRDFAQEQSAEMRASIAEAARAATEWRCLKVEFNELFGCDRACAAVVSVGFGRRPSQITALEPSAAHQRFLDREN